MNLRIDRLNDFYSLVILLDPLAHVCVGSEASDDKYGLQKTVKDPVILHQLQ